MHVPLASRLSRYCRGTTQYNGGQQSCDQSFSHLVPFDLHKNLADDLAMRPDHLHSIVALRMTGAGKLGKCVHKAAEMLRRNIEREPWPIGHRGLGFTRNARYKAGS
jgi:hypothetical protein